MLSKDKRKEIIQVFISSIVDNKEALSVVELEAFKLVSSFAES